MRTVIVGAGIAGLTAAMGLKLLAEMSKFLSRRPN